MFLFSYGKVAIVRAYTIITIHIHTLWNKRTCTHTDDGVYGTRIFVTDGDGGVGTAECSVQVICYQTFLRFVVD